LLLPVVRLPLFHALQMRSGHFIPLVHLEVSLGRVHLHF
jgi:hypothetical protein